MNPHVPPPSRPQAVVTLGEGNTPLVRSRIGPTLGLDHLYFKLEQTNPTGSYKDRFAARLISLLVAGGHPLCLGTSSGNAGAAMAAYSAAAGIRCVLCVPDDAPPAKLVQILAYGAQLVRVRGMVGSVAALRGVLARLREVASARRMPLGVSAYTLSPDAMQGIDPLGQELIAALGVAPDRVFAPVGGGGLLVATWRGLQETSRVPTRIHAVQAAGNDTMVSALHAGEECAREVSTPARISGLVVPLDLHATTALHAVRDSGGDGHVVPDERVWEVQAQLARHEGLYVEPAGAVSVAGLRQAAEHGHIRPGERVVCLLTGHGFKDAAAARRLSQGDGQRDVVVSAEEITAALFERA